MFARVFLTHPEQYLRPDHVPFNREMISACLEVWSTPTPNRAVSIRQVESLLQMMRKQGYGWGHTEWTQKARAHAADKGLEGLDAVLHVRGFLFWLAMRGSCVRGWDLIYCRSRQLPRPHPQHDPLQDMAAAGVNQTRDVYLTRVETHANEGDIAGALSVIKEMAAGPYQGLTSSHDFTLPLIRAYATNNHLSAARELVGASDVSDSTSFAQRLEPLFQAARRNDDPEMAKQLLADLKAGVRSPCSLSGSLPLVPVVVVAVVLWLL